MMSLSQSSIRSSRCNVSCALSRRLVEHKQRSALPLIIALFLLLCGVALGDAKLVYSATTAGELHDGTAPPPQEQQQQQQSHDARTPLLQLLHRLHESDVQTSANQARCGGLATLHDQLLQDFVSVRLQILTLLSKSAQSTLSGLVASSSSTSSSTSPAVQQQKSSDPDSLLDYLSGHDVVFLRKALKQVEEMMSSWGLVERTHHQQDPSIFSTAYHHGSASSAPSFQTPAALLERIRVAEAKCRGISDVGLVEWWTSRPVVVASDHSEKQNSVEDWPVDSASISLLKTFERRHTSADPSQRSFELQVLEEELGASGTISSADSYDDATQQRRAISLQSFTAGSVKENLFALVRLRILGSVRYGRRFSTQRADNGGDATASVSQTQHEVDSSAEQATQEGEEEAEDLRSSSSTGDRGTHITFMLINILRDLVEGHAEAVRDGVAEADALRLLFAKGRTALEQLEYPVTQIRARAADAANRDAVKRASFAPNLETDSSGESERLHREGTSKDDFSPSDRGGSEETVDVDEQQQQQQEQQQGESEVSQRPSTAHVLYEKVQQSTSSQAAQHDEKNSDIPDSAAAASENDDDDDDKKTPPRPSSVPIASPDEIIRRVLNQMMGRAPTAERPAAVGDEGQITDRERRGGDGAGNRDHDDLSDSSSNAVEVDLSAQGPIAAKAFRELMAALQRQGGKTPPIARPPTSPEPLHHGGHSDSTSDEEGESEGVFPPTHPLSAGTAPPQRLDIPCVTRFAVAAAHPSDDDGSGGGIGGAPSSRGAYFPLPYHSSLATPLARDGNDDGGRRGSRHRNPVQQQEGGQTQQRESAALLCSEKDGKLFSSRALVHRSYPGLMTLEPTEIAPVTALVEEALLFVYRDWDLNVERYLDILWSAFPWDSFVEPLPPSRKHTQESSHNNNIPANEGASVTDSSTLSPPHRVERFHLKRGLFDAVVAARRPLRASDVADVDAHHGVAREEVDERRPHSLKLFEWSRADPSPPPRCALRIRRHHPQQQRLSEDNDEDDDANPPRMQAVMALNLAAATAVAPQLTDVVEPRLYFLKDRSLGAVFSMPWTAENVIRFVCQQVESGLVLRSHYQLHRVLLQSETAVIFRVGQMPDRAPAPFEGSANDPSAPVSPMCSRTPTSPRNEPSVDVLVRALTEDNNRLRNALGANVHLLLDDEASQVDPQPRRWDLSSFPPNPLLAHIESVSPTSLRWLHVPKSEWLFRTAQLSLYEDPPATSCGDDDGGYGVHRNSDGTNDESSRNPLPPYMTMVLYRTIRLGNATHLGAHELSALSFPVPSVVTPSGEYGTVMATHWISFLEQRKNNPTPLHTSFMQRTFSTKSLASLLARLRGSAEKSDGLASLNSAATSAAVDAIVLVHSDPPARENGAEEGGNLECAAALRNIAVEHAVKREREQPPAQLFAFLDAAYTEHMDERGRVATRSGPQRALVDALRRSASRRVQWSSGRLSSTSRTLFRDHEKEEEEEDGSSRRSVAQHSKVRCSLIHISLDSGDIQSVTNIPASELSAVYGALAVGDGVAVTNSHTMMMTTAVAAADVHWEVHDALGPRRAPVFRRTVRSCGDGNERTADDDRCKAGSNSNVASPSSSSVNSVAPLDVVLLYDSSCALSMPAVKALDMLRRCKLRYQDTEAGSERSFASARSTASSSVEGGRDANFIMHDDSRRASLLTDIVGRTAALDVQIFSADDVASSPTAAAAADAATFQWAVDAVRQLPDVAPHHQEGNVAAQDSHLRSYRQPSGMSPPTSSRRPLKLPALVVGNEASLSVTHGSSWSWNAHLVSLSHLISWEMLQRRNAGQLHTGNNEQGQARRSPDHITEDESHETVDVLGNDGQQHQPRHRNVRHRLIGKNYSEDALRLSALDCIARLYDDEEPQRLRFRRGI